MPGHPRAHLPLFTAALLLAAMLPAGAQLVPGTLNYQVRLTDNTPQQNPLTAVVSMSFGIWSAQAGGAQLWSEGPFPVTVTNGIFDVVLGSNGSAIASSVFSANPSRWLEITVEGETLTPRQRMTSTGFANVADIAADSDALQGFPASDWQRRVFSSCPAGSSIAQVNADGTVVCETDDSGIQIEDDPEVGLRASYEVPRWTGSSLTGGSMRDTGSEVTVTGALHAAGDVRIDGTLLGDVVVGGRITIPPTTRKRFVAHTEFVGYQATYTAESVQGSQLLAAISLPAGATLQGVWVCFTDDYDSSWSVRLLRNSLVLEPVPAPPLPPVEIASASGYVPGSHYVAAHLQGSYDSTGNDELVVDVGASCSLYGAIVEYTVTKPLP